MSKEAYREGQVEALGDEVRELRGEVSDVRVKNVDLVHRYNELMADANAMRKEISDLKLDVKILTALYNRGGFRDLETYIRDGTCNAREPFEKVKEADGDSIPPEVAETGHRGV